MSLQIVLIIIGCGVVTGVYFSTRLGAKRESDQATKNHIPREITNYDESNINFEFHDVENQGLEQSQLDLDLIEEQQLGLFETFNPASQEIVEASPNENDNEEGFPDSNLLKIYMKPTKDAVFEGPDLLRALNHVGMSYGLMNIFHKNLEGDNGELKILFSAANMFEPGFFDLQAIEAEKCKGLVFFMNIPAMIDDGLALENFLDAIEQVAKTLHGDLYKTPDLELDDDYLDALRLKTNFIIENE